MTTTVRDQGTCRCSSVVGRRSSVLSLRSSVIGSRPLELLPARRRHPLQDQTEDSQQDPRQDINYIMKTEVDRGQDQANYQREKYPKEAADKLPGVNEDHEDDGSVTARKGIMFKSLKSIQSFSDRIRHEDPVKVHRLEMR